MTGFPAVCSILYPVPMPGHKLVTSKLVDAARRAVMGGLINASDIAEPSMPEFADLALAHTPQWVRAVQNLTLSKEQIAAAELPFNRAVSVAHQLHCSGTIMACDFALSRGLGLHFGGGSHHAFSDHGEGFCLLNDMAVAINKLRAEKRISRAVLIDLDAHQGNGTAEIFAGDKDVFTFSLHGKKYPEKKGKSSLDIELPEGISGKDYLRALEGGLKKVSAFSSPDIAVYIAGADPYEHDRIGGMKLTFADMRRRDETVFAYCLARRLPLAVVLGGGYAENPSDTAALHAQTMISAVKMYCGKC